MQWFPVGYSYGYYPLSKIAVITRNKEYSGLLLWILYLI
jgi:hypothetical protein